jgi:SAM-dependent methyltransferase
MATPDPTSTHELFRHDRVADGYASSRPYLHPEVFALARGVIGPARRERALDVGCGTGLSSVALLDLAAEVVGTDVSLEMLRRARRAPGVLYAAAAAESLPFRAGAFDLVVACGSIDWVDKERFLPLAARLLRPGGWLVPLDFGDAGRSPEIPGLAGWYDGVFQARFPRPPARDPIVTAGEAERDGFTAPEERDFAAAWPFTAREYAEFLTTESNVIAAVEYGAQSASDARAWLERELAPLFGDGRHPVSFRGYVQALRRS